jgi:hypothetical protein
MPYPAAGNALSLPGISTSFVNVGTTPALKATTHLTMEAWIHATGPGGGGANGGAIMSREGEYLLSRFPDGTIRYAIANTSPGWNFVNSGVVVPLNQWAHVAFTYNSTNGQIRLYLNGVESYAAAGTGPIGDAITAQNEFRIGSRQGGTTQVFHGQIDEVRVWSISRTASEILDNVRKPVAGTETGLLAYFNFNESTGPSVANSVPGSQPGTLAGTATLVLSGTPMTAPLVTTLEASPVLATRATLRASANPSGSPTAVRFQYGETLAYGTTIDAQDVGGGIQHTQVGLMISNLQPGTTYHYRSVAENDFGTTYGANQTFTTLVLGVGWPTTPKITGGFSNSPKHIVDAVGNAYLAGNFTGSATLKSTMVSQHGTPDAFIGKLGRGADWLWNSPMVTTGEITVHAIALDEARNVHVAGEFSGMATFGTTNLTATGATDLFVAKLDADGAWLWAKSVGAAGEDSANAIAVNPAGEIFVAGHFGGNASFGVHALVASGSQDLFVAKLDAAGEWLWAQGAGGSSVGDSATAIVINSNGDAIHTGLRCHSRGHLRGRNRPVRRANQLRRTVAQRATRWWRGGRLGFKSGDRSRRSCLSVGKIRRHGELRIVSASQRGEHSPPVCGQAESRQYSLVVFPGGTGQRRGHFRGYQRPDLRDRRLHHLDQLRFVHQSDPLSDLLRRLRYLRDPDECRFGRLGMGGKNRLHRRGTKWLGGRGCPGRHRRERQLSGHRASGLCAAFNPQ